MIMINMHTKELKTQTHSEVIIHLGQTLNLGSTIILLLPCYKLKLSFCNPDIIPLSIPAVGTIHGKFECGYLVSVKLGHELLSGVIYHPVNMQCIPSSTTDDLRLAIVPYNPKQPRQASRKRRRKRKRWGGDPSHPKPNRSGYNFFFSEKHALLKSLYPNSREREFTKMIGELWNKLTSQDRIVSII